MITAYTAYITDHIQRTILFLDGLRRRGNQFLDHRRDGNPPVLTFDYEILMDGRCAKKQPVNYALARIIPPENLPADPEKRPIVIIDPRAGHGPGIGGSKIDSEVGIAMENRHPVYFVLFYQEPVNGQTIADVEATEVRFIEKVGTLHPKAPEPAVIGNCQAGWAVAMLGADRPDITGPIIFNGAPLSYWAGVEKKNPMRYRGGLLGGAWLAALISDLGNGTFDGANLVAGFEDLNPANTFWKKQYHLFANIDTEVSRYLNFEKWWNGYFFMSGDEMTFIVENLFIGNQLEKGRLNLEPGRTVDLKKIDDPVVIFASSGDHLTPPQQALNWIVKVYGSVDEIRRLDKVIVYLLHPNIGHLGIFVSGKVAKKEHREIIGSVDLLDRLSPGLYEMIIEEKEHEQGVSGYDVHYEERTFDDILALDDGLEDEKAFGVVAQISEQNMHAYRTFLQPLVRLYSNDVTAFMLLWLHPLRMSRYGFSDLNPMMWPIKALASYTKEHREPVDRENPFAQMEKIASEMIATSLDYYRDMRDLSLEYTFKMIYESPWVKAREETSEPQQNALSSPEKVPHKSTAQLEKGGFAEGAVRIMVAVAGADKSLDKDELAFYEKIARRYTRLRKLAPGKLTQMIRQEARHLQTDFDAAVNALPKLLKSALDRRTGLTIAEKMAGADEKKATSENRLLKKLKALLEK